MEIKKDFIPNYDAYSMNPKYITVHTTRNLSRGANARLHAAYLKNIDSSQKSWHFTVDEEVVIQHLPLDVNGWHAGDGSNGTGNRQSIGIEICENVDGDFAQAKQNTIKLICFLMDELDISIENVVPHKHWSGKDCPHVLLPVWDQFINDIKEEKKRMDLTPAQKSYEQEKQEARDFCKAHNISDGSRLADPIKRIEAMVMIKRYHENVIKPLEEKLKKLEGK